MKGEISRFFLALPFFGETLKNAVCRVPFEPDPAAVGSEGPARARVGQVDGQDLLQPGGQRRVVHRAQELNPAVQIARREVGGPDEVAGGVALPEGENPRVFEVAADDRADPDPLRTARHARAEPADAPDEAIGLATGR